MTRFHWRTGSVGLRWYLTALVALPVLICAALTTVIVAREAAEAASAAHAARGVTTASRLQVVQTDLDGELIPSMGLVLTKIPALEKSLGLGGVTASQAGLSDSVVGRLRARTDAAVDQLAASDATTADPIRAALRTIRAEIDSAIGLSKGFASAVALSDRLATESSEVLRGSASATGQNAIESSVRDALLVGAAARAGLSQLVDLAAFKLPQLGGSPEVSTARAAWLDASKAFDSASQDVLLRASPLTARQWRQGLASTQVAAYDAVLDKYVSNPDSSLSVVQLLTLVQGNSSRSAVFAAISQQAANRATAVAERTDAGARRSALLVGGLVALGLLLSIAVAGLVRRQIAGPLRALAEQARLVSQGELVDITSAGPREVQTAARGLSAAVGSLRRIEAQADAVASGELESDIVREPLPGLLGEVMHRSVTTIIDAIHERDRAQNDLAYQATHDSLTGLPNRHQAMMAIEHALQRARRSGALTGLLFVDLDLFKDVNDNLGHAAGDQVLRVCASRMSAALRDSDVVFRLGGDEFVVLLEDISRDFPFVLLAERMIAAISEPISLPGATATIGASIGVSLCQDASVDAGRLLSEADAATYSAKASGRGRVGVFDHTLRAVLDHRAETEQALVVALNEDELLLHYQPVVEMGTSRPIGYEALIRWQHPTRGMIAPSEFIPIAEKSTLINEIGRWTLREATRQLASWDATGAHPSGLSVAVNISGRHLVTPGLVNDVELALATSGIAPARLVIEITETVLVDDAIALDNMQRLRDLGVVVAIDDFGTGYTSIGQLHKLPVDVIKIDRSFTSSDQPGHYELVRLMVGAAHAFGLAVVAEGVELPTQADSMKALAVDTGQGFFYARPHPAAEAGELASLASLPPVGRPVDGARDLDGS